LLEFYEFQVSLIFGTKVRPCHFERSEKSFPSAFAGERFLPTVEMTEPLSMAFLKTSTIYGRKKMPDFRDAANRHWEDAGLLMENRRAPNADHLFGMAAECALKAAMLGLGIQLRPDGAPNERQHRVHVNALWTEFQSFVGMRNGAKYAALLSAPGNPFSDWEVSQRYENRALITDEMLQRHRNGAGQAMNVLHEAVIEGVV
jgi:hypothetical protein